MRRVLLPFIPVFLLLGLCRFNGQLPAVGQWESFVPAVFAAPALTQDTTRLPPVVIIQAGPALGWELKNHLLQGIHFMYKFYITQLDYAFPEDLTVVIRVIGNKDAYDAYTSRVTTSPVSNHIGLYIYDRQEIVVWKGDNTLLFTKTVFHETSHLLLRSQSRSCPRWLSEGLSEYFEELDLSGAVPVVHAQRHKDKWMKRRLRAGRLPALAAYLACTDRQWSRLDDKSGAPRALAWSLVYYLMDSKPGRQKLKALLAHYRDQPGDSFRLVPVANTGAEPRNFTRFEKKWRRWVAAERAAQPIPLTPGIRS